MRRLKYAILAAAVCLVQPMASASEKWPDRPIRVVVPYTPGGGTDGVTRILTDRMARATQWNMVVENKPGAGGNIGLNQVAKSDPDGYMVGMGQTANLAINPAVLPNMPFDAAKEFRPIVMVAEFPLILVVREDAPWRSVADVVADAKKQEDRIRQAVAALGTVGHLAGEMLANRADAKFLVVPYKGAAPALNDLIGQQTDIMFASPPSVMQLIESRKVRALAVTSAKRMEALPDVPTVAEAGYPGFDAVDWKVLVAPAATPQDVVDRLNTAANEALRDAALLSQLKSEGSKAIGGSAQDASAYIASQQQTWAELVRASNIKF